MQANEYLTYIPLIVFCKTLAGYLAQPAPARAEGAYTIGPDDVLAVSVWEHPELSRTVAVHTDGMITVPPLGDLQAAGKTTEVLARELESRIYNTLRLTTQVTITVVAFNSQKIFLAGQVNNPGKFSFETIPNLVDLLGMTGGINPQADLSQVRILRRKDGGNESFTVDLSQAVQTGDLSNVPALQSGDLVVVPSAASAGGSVGGGSPVYVLGEVAKPGPYNALPGMDLMQLLSVAGGLTPRGDMSEVEIIAQAGTRGGYRIRVNLTQEMRQGRGGIPVRPGDTIVVGSKGGNLAGTAWGVFRETLSASRDFFLSWGVIKP